MNAYMPVVDKNVDPAPGFTPNAQRGKLKGENLRIDEIVGSFNVKADRLNK